MTDSNSHTDSGDESLAPDGGLTQAAQKHRETDYLDREVNILKPSTAYMRDHLRVVWTGFIVWTLIVFGPVTATAIAPGAMTATMPVLGFPLHYFLVAFGAPTGALVLAAVYARQRDKLDDKYGIDHSRADTGTEEEAAGEATAADGGVAE